MRDHRYFRFSVFLALMLLFAALSGSVYEAASYNYEYFTLTEPSFLTPSLSAGSDIRLYQKQSDMTRGVNGIKLSDSRIVVLDPGTYYLRPHSSTYYYSYSWSTAVTWNNYTRSRAVPLEKNTTETILQTKRSHYMRWYKITLPSRQKITITANTAPARHYIYVYNSAYDRLSVLSSKSGSNTVFYTKRAHPKGTYYICVSYNASVLRKKLSEGEYITISWK